MKTKQRLQVVHSEKLQDGIYTLSLQYKKETKPTGVRPGQFVGVYPDKESALLPRPISICRYHEEYGVLTMVYRVAGKGTDEFSKLKEGDQVSVLSVLGNGYEVEELAGKNVFLLGGGIGIPPMLQLACSLKEQNAKLPTDAQGKTTAILGYRDAHMFLMEEFREAADEVLVATEDGSVGTKGNVMNCIEEQGIVPDVICACGPMPMLRAIRTYAKEKGIPAYISLEERMACGVGACLGCVVKTREVDGHSHVHNTRICTEGPVFLAEDVDI